MKSITMPELKQKIQESKQNWDKAFNEALENDKFEVCINLLGGMSIMDDDEETPRAVSEIAEVLAAGIGLREGYDIRVTESNGEEPNPVQQKIMDHLIGKEWEGMSKDEMVEFILNKDYEPGKWHDGLYIGLLGGDDWYDFCNYYAALEKTIKELEHIEGPENPELIQALEESKVKLLEQGNFPPESKREIWLQGARDSWAGWVDSDDKYDD